MSDKKARRITTAVLKGYQILAPYVWSSGLGAVVPSGCRSYPSCSDYTIQMIEKDGVLAGTLKGLKRVLACNPFREGNYKNS